MISSIVARVSAEFLSSGRIKKLAAHPGIELGNIVRENALPLTIEAANEEEMSRIHNWIGALRGVEWLDVVFVYLDVTACSTIRDEGKQE